MEPELAAPLMTVALAAVVTVALAGFALSTRRPSAARSALVAQVLVAGFFHAVVVTPTLQADADAPDSARWASLVAFVAVLGLLKLLGRFEES
jgi:protein-S-isoprenylcysteine O-methyltransferase Ste14